MRFSKMFIPTLREIPAEAEAVSHILMLRAGYIRQLASGLYIYLPLGWRVLERINKIIKEEMDSIGAQEISMPVLHPAELWQQTGRWFEIKEEMFRLRDRGGREMCLGMTHEEVITWLAAREIRSYRDLPQVWYQIHTKLRDEARPRSGVLRTREFLMKDSYSFDKDVEGLEESYQRHAEAYHKIFRRCGLRFYQVESDPGMMGGATAHEFMALSPAGEDKVVLCEGCGYAANVEIALSAPLEVQFVEMPLEEVYTPKKRTVEEVSDFLGMRAHFFIKSILLMAGEKPVLALIRGEQELNEKKLQKIIGTFRVVSRDEVREILGVSAGFIGPMGHDIDIIADLSLKDGVYVSGANKEDYHIRGIRPGIDFQAEWHDIHVAKEGDRCSRCNSELKIERCIEVGNIFKLGTRYSIPLKAFYLDEQGKERPIVMGSYGIGPARIVAAAIEQNHDRDGIIWHEGIAPFDVEILPLSMNSLEVIDVSQSLYDGIKKLGIEVLIDDRNVSPGVKFKDADLIGIPWQIIIGERNLREGFIELKSRRTGQIKRLTVSGAIARIKELYGRDISAT